MLTLSSPGKSKELQAKSKRLWNNSGSSSKVRLLKPVCTQTSVNLVLWLSCARTWTRSLSKKKPIYPSHRRSPGRMHACGHDAHTSCLVSVARRLVASPPPQGRIRLLFQPAEEGAGGADEMIREGVLADPQLRAIFGLHFWSLYPTGTLSITEGPAMGSVDHLTIRLRGKGGHAAMPQDTTDALTAGAYLVTQLQTLVSRRLDPIRPAVLTIGKFQAGDAFNVIPEEALLVGDHSHITPRHLGTNSPATRTNCPRMCLFFWCTRRD